MTIRPEPQITEFNPDLYAELVLQASRGMSRFQIERFVIGSEPPIGRFKQCCMEIKARYQKVLELHAIGSQDQINDLVREMEIFRELAETWKPLAEGKTEDEIQSIYWDQRFSLELATRLLSRSPVDDLLKRIMALDPESQCRQILAKFLHGGCNIEAIMIDVNSVVDRFYSTRPALEDKSMP